MEEDGEDKGYSYTEISQLESEARVNVGKKKASKRSSLNEEDFINLFHGSDPVRIELDRLQNEVKEKIRELAEANSENKGLRMNERSKDKALFEATEELKKMSEKLQVSETATENKNLDIKRLSDEKKGALAAQFAAEATLRRVYAAQKDEELLPLEAMLLPLEGEIKILKYELSRLQDDNRTLERLSKSKETALLEAEREVHSAKLKAALVDEVQNRNQDLMKQNEICQEEYKILDRMHRLKVAEVEKLGQTISELEEALLSGAAAANAVRDYQRQVSELKGEKRTLERTLSRAKVTENRVAVVIANEWKDVNDKVMPVKQWLEERRILMGEMQNLREKLSISERATKSEAQLKERFQLRLKVLEDALRSSSRSLAHQGAKGGANCLLRSHSINNSDFSIAPLSSGNTIRKYSQSHVTSSIVPTHTNIVLKHAKGASRSFDGCRSSNEESCITRSPGEGTSGADNACSNDKGLETSAFGGDEYVSTVFYDIIQKEVIALRKATLEKEHCLRDKDNYIEMLSRKVDTLSKAIEVETKKFRREKAAIEKEVASIRVLTKGVGRKLQG